MPTLNNKASTAASVVLGLAILAVGLFMLVGGIYLIVLGGSWYFGPAGLGLSIAGILLARRRAEGSILYLLIFAATVVWALWDVGPAFWPLVSRLFAPTVLAVPVLLLVPALRPALTPLYRKLAYGGATSLVAALAATVVAAFQPLAVSSDHGTNAPVAGRAVNALGGGDWPHWGRTPSGTRFAPLTQITPDNVANLKVAWTYRTGDIPKDPAAFVTTPLHVDGKLYGCTQTSVIFALDSDTGKELWRYDPHAQGNFRPRCRGVGYHDASAAVSGGAPSALCVRRILSTTVDARLVALDADTGAPCPDFGNDGAVNLRSGMGELKPGFYFPTAAPTVVRNVVIVGGLVRDNYETSEPPGVVRAFDVRTGALVWAWDLGQSEQHGIAASRPILHAWYAQCVVHPCLR